MSTDLTEKFTGLETQLADQQTDMLAKVESVKGADAISLTDLNNLLGLLLTSIDGLASTVVDLAATVETLNSNAALNAQNSQTILLGSVGACCDTGEPLTGVPDAMCQKAQQLIASMPTFTQFVEDATDGTKLPSVQSILDAFTITGDDGEKHVLISTTDANKVLAAINTVGPSALGDIHDLAGDAGLQAALKAILGTASNSASAYNAVQAIPTSGYTQSPAVVRAFLSFYAQSVINALWASPAILSGDGYEDDCSDPPPFEGVGYKSASFIIPDDGTDTFFTIGSSIDMLDDGDGNINPAPFAAVGETVHVWLCFNQTDNEDLAVAIGTIDNDLGSVFMTVNPGIDNTFVMPNERFLHAFGYHRAADTGTGTAWIVFAWDASTASSHCPE